MTGFTLSRIAQALGGEVRHRRYVMVPGPGHSRHDRSLKVWIEAGDRVCCTTYSTADSWAACMDHVRARLGLPAFVPGRREERHEDRRSPEDRLVEAVALWQSAVADHRADGRLAARLWNEAIDPTGTPGEAYLAGRHLALVDDMAGRIVRFHPACPCGDERRPALLVRFAPIVHPAETVPWGDDPPVEAVQRIFLDPSKPKGHDGKRLLGHPFDLPKPLLRGGVVEVPASRPVLAIKLSGDEAVEQGLHIAEGFESGLAAMQFGFRPLWAVYSARALQLFPVLAGISALTIMADHDRNGAGQMAARACRQRWGKASDSDIFIHISETVGDDWADGWARHCRG